ncbi:butyrophilin subfamily 3 member A2-like isoform X2 [Thunnus albacares]|uniref:butyrophilin subfamily 3 member A2-like isoform X2 n=1 Tax=Thunnus albacares TaxID=8236 RepID=UPI001CF68986|nr:butyrophilin subfamily 3 member A2-like isoform X2 [Thunnus albacares]
MLLQTNRQSLQSPLKTLRVLVVHLLLTHSCKGNLNSNIVSGQSQLIGSSQPIVATVGDDIILPCHLEPAMDVAAMTLEWTRSDMDSIFVHLCRAGQDVIHVKHPSYKGRTSLFTDELKQGNISLKLSKVKLSDGGKYKCNIPKLNTQSFDELFVASGAVCSPVISIADVDRDRGGVVLQCESKGWHPQPEVFWLDGEGNLLSAGPTETVRGPDDLYTVSSRVTVEKRHNNNFTCRVQQNNINQIRETHIIVSDDFFKVQSSSSPVTVGLVVCIVLIVAAAVFFFGWKWRQNMIKTKRSHRDETEGGSKNVSKSNDTQTQPLNAAGTEGETVYPTVSAENKIQRLMNSHQESERKLKAQYEESEKKQDELQKEKKKLELEVTDLNSRLSMKETEIEAKQDEIKKLQDENKKLQTDRGTKTDEIETPTNNYQESERKLKALHEKEIQTLKSNNEELERDD